MRSASDVAGRVRTLRAQHVPALALECGVTLRDVQQAYYLDGALNEARDNLVVVLHALTGSADAAGDWWRGLIGPGLAIDTNRYAVLAPNLLGSCYGTTGPSTYREFPSVTPRDMATLVGVLVDALGARSLALVTGGSLGGMVALEWALLHPGRARATVVFAAPAAHTALGIGWNHVQRRALLLGAEGLALARMIAMLSFRTEEELARRFDRARDSAGEFEARTYLMHHGEKLAARFDAATYRVLLDAMDAHDVGRARDGTERALGQLRGRVVAVGIPGDRLYSANVVAEWAASAGAEYREIASNYGHDAFLLERAQVGHILTSALTESPASPVSPRQRHVTA